MIYIEFHAIENNIIGKHLLNQLERILDFIIQTTHYK